MKDHIKNKYDAILMIGGWNNTIEVSYIPYIVYKAIKKKHSILMYSKKYSLIFLKILNTGVLTNTAKQWLIKSGTIQILNIH